MFIDEINSRIYNYKRICGTLFIAWSPAVACVTGGIGGVIGGILGYFAVR